jgi:hypothetical protein
VSSLFLHQKQMKLTKHLQKTQGFLSTNLVRKTVGGSSGTGNPPELDALVREDECEKYMKSMRRENTNYYKIAF